VATLENVSLQRGGGGRGYSYGAVRRKRESYNALTTAEGVAPIKRVEGARPITAKVSSADRINLCESAFSFSCRQSGFWGLN
jgi:hypothetical protein